MSLYPEERARIHNIGWTTAYWSNEDSINRHPELAEIRSIAVAGEDNTTQQAAETMRETAQVTLRLANLLDAAKSQRNA